MPAFYFHVLNRLSLHGGQQKLKVNVKIINLSTE